MSQLTTTTLKYLKVYEFYGYLEITTELENQVWDRIWRSLFFYETGGPIFRRVDYERLLTPAIT